MSNVQKFFNKNVSNDVEEQNDFFASEENEAIEIKLIKLKSQGLIGGYHYNFYRNIWEIKGNNGVSCECRLDNNAECFGDIKFIYKTQSIKKYLNNSATLADALNSVLDELEEMYQEELEEIKLKEEEKLDSLNFTTITFGNIETTAVA